MATESITPASPLAQIEQIVADADTGRRQPTGWVATFLLGAALVWALFQYWYASPLPFVLGIGILNDTEARAIHLALALFLAFLAWPATRRSSRKVIPLQDWILACLAAFAGAYVMLFYRELSLRPGQPSTMDIVVSCMGLVLLLEATRRAVGLPMAILAVIFLAYCMGGPWLPDVIAHKGASLNRVLSHMWLTTEGVYGIALGVSAGTIFVYVLFGALLDRAGGGNYMMQVSFAALGHLRGGPAKVAVISSAMNGMISGSSVANVVSGGIFTIPLMKKSGYGGIKAGAIETMASVDGQIMPPVMGAAAFLMVEYVGIPYSDIIRHALLPALLSYIGLFYIVHLEAIKLGMMPIVQRTPRPRRTRLMRNALGLSGSIVVIGILYYLFLAIDALLGAAAPYVTMLAMFTLYLVSVREAARSPDIPQDIDVAHPKPLDTWPTVRAGLHFILPIGTLIWCLMVKEMSPALAAFWAITTLAFLMLTQNALIRFFRKQPLGDAWRAGFASIIDGFGNGARNMIGIGIATATAGIIVGAITLTGLGLRMTEFVEFVAQGDVMFMLIFVAFSCLVLGLGVPTTANYVLVATLMAPVVVELGAQSGLVIPLIAVHLFVFYYGIMADITPPVGLATFAAAAISGEDAVKTGIQGAVYAARTLILPFIWIFNPQILLIGIDGTFSLISVLVASTCATLLFAAVTMKWFRTRSRWWETVLLLGAIALLFRPDYFMNKIAPEYVDQPAAQMYDIARDLPENGQLTLVIEGMTLEGKDLTKTVALRVGAPAADGRTRMAAAGVQFMSLGNTLQIGMVNFGSPALKAGFEQGWTVQSVKVRNDRPNAHWFYLPAVLLVALVWWTQGRRLTPPTRRRSRDDLPPTSSPPARS